MIAEFQRHWSAQYWSQASQLFGHVPLTLDGDQNPVQLVNVRWLQRAIRVNRVGDQVAAICAQVDRPQFVTTSFTRWTNNFDLYVMADRIDLARGDACAR